jgi:hypothetical protein
MRIKNNRRKKGNDLEEEFFIDSKIIFQIRDKVKNVMEMFYNGLEANTLKSIEQNEKYRIQNLLISLLLSRVLQILDERLYNPINIDTLRKQIKLEQMGTKSIVTSKKKITYVFVTEAINSSNYITVDDDVLNVLINSELHPIILMLSVLKKNREEILRIFKFELNNQAVSTDNVRKTERELFKADISKAYSDIASRTSRITQKKIYEHMGIVRQTFEGRLSKYKIKWEPTSKLFTDKESNRPI